MAGRITTVLGDVPPEEVGFTLTHEHLLINMEVYWHPPEEVSLRTVAEGPVRMEVLGELRRNPMLIKDNLSLTDLEAGIEELNEYRKLGGDTLVEVTPPDIGRDPRALQIAARRTGLKIVAGCGHYVGAAHPPGLSEEPVEAIAERIVREAEEGIGDTGVRPGIIGEIGTSDPLHPDEGKVLRAAARAQQETGLAITLHLDPAAAKGLEILDILESEGADPARIVMGHLDATIEQAIDYHWELARRGCFVQYDGCGSESYWPGLVEGGSFWLPLDASRVRAVYDGLEAGYGDRLLLSQDVCKKMDLTRFGGFGYGHIARSLIPNLREAGVSNEEIHRIVVENPRRVLSH